MMVDVKGYPGYMINENGVVINKKGHAMRPALSNVGRLRVTLERYDENGKLVSRTNKSISRLVAENFIPNPDNLPVVMHKDNDILHDHVSNLKWGTQSENIIQAFTEGRKTSNFINSVNLYEVHNKDNSISYKCKGTKGVAELVGFSTEKSIRPGVIKSGEYKGFIITNTHKKIISPIIFE